jgi:hypothetical protein
MVTIMTLVTGKVVDGVEREEKQAIGSGQIHIGMFGNIDARKC